MKLTIHFHITLIGWLVLGSVCGITGVAADVLVSPKMGGGQVEGAPMIHIDIFYDAAANQMSAILDESQGMPELVALPSGCAFESDRTYSVLAGKAYNYQYGWNPGGLFSIPTGAAIWIELVNSSPGLETYDGRGTKGTYEPLFGTAGSSRLWKWSGVMTHNTYAVWRPNPSRLFATYRIYFGDESTGAREAFADLDSATVTLQWTTQPVSDSNFTELTLGAFSPTANSPLRFVNGDSYSTNTGCLACLASADSGGSDCVFSGDLRFAALAATAVNGGPVEGHAALGACLQLQLISLAGPPGGYLDFWEPDAPQPRFRIRTGSATGTNLIQASESAGEPGADPYGRILGRRCSTSCPGLYSIGLRILDSSTNGPAGGPVHAPSEVLHLYFQAGVTIASLNFEGNSATALFGGQTDRVYYLESASMPLGSHPWQTVAGPLVGTNRVQRLVDPNVSGSARFYRLRAEVK